MVALLEKEKMVEALEKSGPWMIVKRKFQRNPRPNGNIFAKIQAKERGGSGPKENHKAVLLASIGLELISGDLRLKASGPFESTMKTNPSILDPGRHSVVSFKENVIPNSSKDLEKVASGVAEGHPFSKG
ncbi:hypothetical protein GOBAR_DD36718 [Gossypium barbadense]|nr:hypothetical protein GOBAR_DD36718 [Gossypium barbadense]